MTSPSQEDSPGEGYPELLETSRKEDDSLWPSGPRCLAGTRYTDADMYDDAKVLGNAKFRADDRGRIYRKGLEPGSTWELHGPATASCWAPDSKESGGRQRSRRVIHPGKRALDGGEMTMPRDWWHVEAGVRWSESRDFGLCEVCGTVLAAGLPPGKQKYCSIGDCARIGSNAVRRANSHRKRHPRFKRDADGWYINAAFPARSRRHLPRVHAYADREAKVLHTVSRDCRLRPPWNGAPQAWRIGLANTETAPSYCFALRRKLTDKWGVCKWWDDTSDHRVQLWEVAKLTSENGRFASKDEGTNKGRITTIEVIPPPQHLASSTPVPR